jgi:hypothetical protein
MHHYSSVTLSIFHTSSLCHNFIIKSYCHSDNTLTLMTECTGSDTALAEWLHIQYVYITIEGRFTPLALFFHSINILSTLCNFSATISSFCTHCATKSQYFNPLPLCYSTSILLSSVKSIYQAINLIFHSAWQSTSLHSSPYFHALCITLNVEPLFTAHICLHLLVFLCLSYLCLYYVCGKLVCCTPI